MLKSKFKIITILAVIILALTLPVVRAENEIADDSVTPAMNSVNGNSETSDAEEENFKRSDVYLTGDDVTIDYIIDGNLFVVANNVTINSQIGGDAFICANTVTIEEQGYIFSNLFTLSQNVTINGVVYDLYSASENTTINGYVYRDIRIGSNTVNIFGTVGRNAYVDCANLNFAQETNSEEDESDTASQGIINGNLNYTAKQQASIPEGSVTGETTFEKELSFDGNSIQKQIMSLGTFIVTVIVIWLLCLWLSPKFLKEDISLLTTKKVLPIIGFGILTPIIGILLTIVLLILGLTAKLALLLLISLVALMMISSSVFIIVITNIICDKLKIEKRAITFGILVACSIALWIINLIPFIGSLVEFVAVVLGLGIIASSLILKEKKDTTI